MKIIVAARTHASQDTYCHGCGRRRRCALIYLASTNVGGESDVRICAGCSKAAWEAARTKAADRKRSR